MSIFKNNSFCFIHKESPREHSDSLPGDSLTPKLPYTKWSKGALNVPI